MKKKLTFLFLILLSVVFCGAQSMPSQILSTQGGFSKSNDYSLEWTLGETVATTSATSDYIYTQGFNQSFILIGKKKESYDELITVFVAPNPVTANLTVAIKTAVQGNYAVVMTNLSGINVYQRRINLNSQKLSIDMRGFANGAYLLRVFDANNRVLNTSKVIKL